MTMHIVFKQDKDGYKKDQDLYVETTLARRFVRDGVAITYQQHLDDLYDQEQAEKKEKERLEAEKKAALLKKKESKSKEKAVSKKTKKTEKSVKK